MDFDGINWLAALVAAVASFAIGGLWYSPALFAKVWQREAKVTDADIAGGSVAMAFGGAFVFALVSAIVFAGLLGPDPEFSTALGTGFAVGLGLVAASFGINYLFERKSPTLFAINGGYHVAQFTAYGLILGLWH